MYETFIKHLSMYLADILYCLYFHCNNYAQRFCLVLFADKKKGK